jgi:hypothetical protein
LLANAASDGKMLSETRLEAAPVEEGIAVAGGRLFLIARDGSLLCLSQARLAEPTN